MALPMPVEQFSIPQPVHPVRAARGKLGLSTVKFATVLGVSLITLRNALNGEAAKPSSVIRGMQALGHDPAQVIEEYTAWRNWNRDRMLTVANAGTTASPLDNTAEGQAAREAIAHKAAVNVGEKLAEVIRAVAERPSTAASRIRELEEWKKSLLVNGDRNGDLPEIEASLENWRAVDRRVW